MTDLLLLALLPGPAALAAPPAPAAPARAAVEVAVDRRVEAVSVAARLAGYAEYRQADGPYAQAADAWFAPCAEHRAVRELRTLRQQAGISYNAPVDLALHLDPDTLAPRVAFDPLPPRLDDRWTPKSAARTARLLAAFAEDCDVDGFLVQQSDRVAVVEDTVRGRVEGWQVIAWFDEVLGPVEGARYRVVAGMLTGDHNYGCSVELPDRWELSPVLGMGRRGPDDEGIELRWDVVELLLVHEYGHAYANPVFYTQDGALGAAWQAAYPHVADQMKAQAYGEPAIVGAETGTRALTVLYTGDRHGPAAARAQRNQDEDAGFYWLGSVVDALEAHRDARPALLSAASDDVAAAVQAWAVTPTRPSFRGPVNAVFSGPWWPDRIVVLRPAGPDDDPVRAYAAAMHQRFFAPKGARLLDAGDLPDTPVGMVIYGTPSDIPALPPLLQAAGIELEPQAITVAGERHEGDDLALIAAFPHPAEPTLPVLVYTATDPARVDGLNGVFHGPTSWTLVRVHDGQREVVATGAFPPGD